MASAAARMTETGHVELPVAVRRALGLEHGGTVEIEVAGDELRLRRAASVDGQAGPGLSPSPKPIDEVVEELQAMSRVLLGDYSGSAVDELIAERRFAFAQEEAEAARYAL